MTITSKDKLNAIHLAGSVGIAALFAALAGNWQIFILVAGGLIAAGLISQEIRLPRNPRGG